jgi:hypothetical protein
MPQQCPAVPQQQRSFTTHQPMSWDNNAMLQSAPSYGSAFKQYEGEWIMDSGATSHVTGNQGNLSHAHSPLELYRHHIVVGNGSRLPVLPLVQPISHLAPSTLTKFLFHLPLSKT